MSPGQQASACALSGRRLVCWGDGYSPASDPARPVPIVARPRSSRETAVIEEPFRKMRNGRAVDGQLLPWGPACLVHARCDREAAPAPVCPPGTVSAAWSELEPHAASLARTRVHVRGQLRVGVWPPRGVWGGAGQCDSAWEYRGEIGLDEGPALGLACLGDESRLCCDAHAYGQTVVASGVLFNDTAHSGRWALRSTRLCVVEGDRGGAGSP